MTPEGERQFDEQAAGWVWTVVVVVVTLAALAMALIGDPPWRS